MRRFRWAALAVTALAFSPLAASAQEGDREALFKKLDKNGDGFISKDEVGEDQQALFTRLLRQDKNEDGKLSLDEFLAGTNEDRPRRPDGPPREGQPRDGQPGRPGEGRPNEGRPGDGRPGDGRPMGPPAGDVFMRLFDTDKDGKLSKAELTVAGEILTKLDKDNDGEVSRQELGAGMMALVGPPPGGRPDGPRPDGPRPEGNQPGNPRPEGQRIDPEQMLSRLKQADANGDGKLSKDEAPDRMRENFDRLDTNSDGFLDDAELRKAVENFSRMAAAAREGGGGGEFIERIFKEADKNNDGKLSKEEAPERMRENFERLDRNTDGFIDLEELRATLGRRQGDNPPRGERPNSDGDQPRGERKPDGDQPRRERKPDGEQPRGERKPDGDQPRREGKPDGEQPRRTEKKDS